MIGASGNIQVWVATSPVDMRKSFDGLAEVVRAFLGHDPLCGSMFLFRNRSAERVKILWWDRDGLAIYYKRLEKGTFQFPASGGKSLAISSAELVKLLLVRQRCGDAMGTGITTAKIFFIFLLMRPRAGSMTPAALRDIACFVAGNEKVAPTLNSK